MNPSVLEPTAATEKAVLFHVSLNVANLERAVAFYRALLGVEPVKRYDNYAKFELEQPPLVLSLKPRRPGPGGTLNHLGFRVPTSAHLVEMQRRLESAHFRTSRQDGVECCYARQTKCWASDPDGTLWEIYVLEGDIPHCGGSHGLKGALPSLRALGFYGSLRRGFGNFLGTLRGLFRGKNTPAPAELPTPAGQP